MDTNAPFCFIFEELPIIILLAIKMPDMTRNTCKQYSVFSKCRNQTGIKCNVILAATKRKGQNNIKET